MRFDARFRRRARRAAIKVFNTVISVHWIFSQRRSLYVYVTIDDHLSVGKAKRFELIDPNGVKSHVVIVERIRRFDGADRYVVTSRLRFLDGRDERILDETVSILLIFEILVACGVLQSSRGVNLDQSRTVNKAYIFVSSSSERAIHLGLVVVDFHCSVSTCHLIVQFIILRVVALGYTHGKIRVRPIRTLRLRGWRVRVLHFMQSFRHFQVIIISVSNLKRSLVKQPGRYRFWLVRLNSRTNRPRVRARRLKDLHSYIRSGARRSDKLHRFALRPRGFCGGVIRPGARDVQIRVRVCSFNIR